MSHIASTSARHDKLIENGPDNRISEVTVFTDHAYLKRQVRCTAEQGINRFLVALHSFSVDPDSVQASVRGHGELLGVQYQEIPVADAPQSKLRALEEEKRTLTHQSRLLQSEKKTLERQNELLDSVVAFGQIEVPKKIKTSFPDLDQLDALLQFIDEKQARLNEKMAALAQREEELQRALQVVEQKLKQRRSDRKNTRKVIEVLFSAQQAHEIAVETAYSAQPATWTPVYKIDVTLDLADIHLSLFAHIEQRSGENWRDVHLTVSTAVPLKGAALPDLQTWRLDGAAHAALRSADFTTLGAAAAPAGGEAGAAMEEEPAPEATLLQAEPQEQPLAFEYRLPQTVSIDADGTETLLPLFQKELDGEFFVYLAPRIDPLGYLVCRTTADKELLSGRLNVHFGGRFVATTRLDEKKPGDELLINFGAHRGVRCQREKITDKIAESRFGGMVDRLSVVRELRYRITLENLKSEPVAVRLLDAIPVSRTDRIQVKDVKIRPEPITSDDRGREGVMRWELKLGAGETREIRIEFYVKHPKDYPPYGL